MDTINYSYFAQMPVEVYLAKVGRGVKRSHSREAGHKDMSSLIFGALFKAKRLKIEERIIMVRKIFKHETTN
jgi:hypothetical protein